MAIGIPRSLSSYNGGLCGWNIGESCTEAAREANELRHSRELVRVAVQRSIEIPCLSPIPMPPFRPRA